MGATEQSLSMSVGKVNRTNSWTLNSDLFHLGFLASHTVPGTQRMLSKCLPAGYLPLV
jgi:hypothetical protein